MGERHSEDKPVEGNTFIGLSFLFFSNAVKKRLNHNF